MSVTLFFTLVDMASAPYFFIDQLCLVIFLIFVLVITVQFIEDVGIRTRLRDHFGSWVQTNLIKEIAKTYDLPNIEKVFAGVEEQSQPSLSPGGNGDIDPVTAAIQQLTGGVNV